MGVLVLTHPERGGDTEHDKPTKGGMTVLVLTHPGIWPSKLNTNSPRKSKQRRKTAVLILSG